MGCLGNILWLIFGGLATAIEYFISGTVMICTIIGIPFGLQIYKLGVLALWPFGSKVTPNPQSSGGLNLFLNILWIIIGGIWIALTHLLFGVLCCITIIGIPFGLQHFKLAGLALTPFGKTIS